MKLHLENSAARRSIQTYGPGYVRVDQTTFTASLIVTPERVIADWRPQRPAELSASDLEGIPALAPEVVLLGTGSRLHFPPAAVLMPLIAAQIGYEVMDTGAACRTFNVLAGEGRRVVAALLLIGADQAE